MLKKTFALIFGAVLFVACSDQGPCAGIDCGGHGYCEVDDESGNASCVCDDGYVADGMKCVKECVPACGDRNCGPDPVCGLSCGECGQDQRCGYSGQCVCAQNCTNRVCGPDPVCGLSCGGCGEDWLFCDTNGKCMSNTVGRCFADWCLIPAGTFAMGSPDDEPDREPDEGPVHNVTITRPFYMKKTLVTRGEWKSLIGNNPSKDRACSDHCPIQTLNWFDAVWYANALSKSEGLETCYTITDCTGAAGVDLADCKVTFSSLDCNGYRLPTEAEWEYAARAGTTEARYGEVDDIAWYLDNSRWNPHPVGMKTPNAWGLHDVLGNEYELVWDYYGEDYYSTCEEGCTDPLGPTTGIERAARGSCYASPAKSVRLALRVHYPPEIRLPGFRLVRSVP